MTTLQEAAQKALEFLEQGTFVYPTQLADDLKAALAQQGEQPTQRQLDTAMRQWETWKAYALELQAKVVKYEGGSPMLLNAAAPAPQAQPVAQTKGNP